MNNPRITPREIGLLKGAVNRVFSRSELRRQVLDASAIEHNDPNRKRVTKWCRCNDCKQPVAQYQAVVDHIQPRVPLDSAFDLMSLDEYRDRTWCTIETLQTLCIECHKRKSKIEAGIRKEHRNKRLGITPKVKKPKKSIDKVHKNVKDRSSK